MIYSLVDFTATTVKLTAGSDEFIFKKVYCTTTVKGDYLVFSSHQAETNTFRQQYAILYTDCAAPVGTSAADLKIKIDRIINGYTVGATNTYYGSFYDTTTQTNAGATSENIIGLNSTYEANQVSVVAGNQITVSNAGVYNIQFSGQFEKTSGPDTYIDLWLKKNGSNVAASNTEFDIHHNNGTYVPAWNFVLTLAAGDYVQLAWHSPDTTVQITSQASAVSPNRPSIPGMIVTVTEVMSVAPLGTIKQVTTTVSSPVNEHTFSVADGTATTASTIVASHAPTAETDANTGSVINIVAIPSTGAIQFIIQGIQPPRLVGAYKINYLIS